MRVLVADDDVTYQELLRRLLTNWNFQPDIVADGRAAIEALRASDPPPLAILDWEMPEADGFEVARFIRTQQTTREAYVLMITGSRKKQDMERVLVCGADDYLIKPFSPLDLKIHLRNAMRIVHLQQELADLMAPAAASRAEAARP